MCIANDFRVLTFNIGDPLNTIEIFINKDLPFNIVEIDNIIESCIFQRVTFSILVIIVLFPN
ncbi:hypothetical protein GCM10011445_22320 [Pseudocitrobacter faecalis]|nr:hypothetical protein GCM10011445_22320 [Pseudocitrobacter faecalis]